MRKEGYNWSYSWNYTGDWYLLTRQTPVARHQQQTGASLAVRQLILRQNHLRLTTPDLTLSVRLADF